MSRPIRSVPNGYSALGGRRASYTASRPLGHTSGPTKANASSRANSTRPRRAARCRTNRVATVRHWLRAAVPTKPEASGTVEVATTGEVLSLKADPRVQVGIDD